MREEREFVHLKLLAANGQYKKNILYKITNTEMVQFAEEHEDTGSREIVDLDYRLKAGQYGIFAHEYRSQNASKSYKTADVLACVVDDVNRKIYTTIFDVKRNISAFSDDLLKGNAMLTAVKEVRDFIRQIHDEVLHKNSFMIYYLDAGYMEEERFGLVTSNFEEHKFAEAADLLEHLLGNGADDNNHLVALKMKINLKSYVGEAEKLRAFAAQKIEINGRLYPLYVFLLDKVSDLEYRTSVKMAVSENSI